MNRMQELNDILNEPMPPALETSVKRAKARYKKSKVGRWCGIPVASLAGVAALFVLLVNTSIPFARACGNIPLLKGLATAVAFSPSLKAAVENDYVQPIGQEQVVNDVTMRVEYLIVDKKQVNIFYSLKSSLYSGMDGVVDLKNADGTELQAAISWGNYVPQDTDDALRKITIDFSSGSVPDTLLLDYGAWPSEYADSVMETAAPPTAYQGPFDHSDDEEEHKRPAHVADFSFTLHLDPAFTETGKIYTLNQPIELDGQRITVEDVEVYPTHVRLNLKDDPTNTAWLKSLDFYLEDEKGNRYEKISNGISAFGSSDGSHFYPSHMLESSYFGDAEHLTVHITGATWLDKDNEYIELNITGGTATHLPQGVTLGKAERVGDNVDVILVVESHGGGTYGVLYDGWLDSDGGHHDVNRRGAGSPFEEAHDFFGVNIPAGSFYETFTLKDCTWDNVKLGVSFSRFSTFETPISVDVK